VFDERVDQVLSDVCMEIERRYELKFIEIGVDKVKCPREHLKVAEILEVK
jgi:hypothetical protein